MCRCRVGSRRGADIMSARHLFASNDAAKSFADIEDEAQAEARAIVAEREDFYRQVDASGMDEAARNHKELCRQIARPDDLTRACMGELK